MTLTLDEQYEVFAVCPVGHWSNTADDSCSNCTSKPHPIFRARPVTFSFATILCSMQSELQLNVFHCTWFLVTSALFSFRQARALLNLLGYRVITCLLVLPEMPPFPTSMQFHFVSGETLYTETVHIWAMPNDQSKVNVQSDKNSGFLWSIYFSNDISPSRPCWQHCHSWDSMKVHHFWTGESHETRRLIH